ncbi:hypothetical protein NDK50_09500 [Paraburkholderia bryophila]|uniref:hypothetical protein n=1 Tax=Paraburkholderia bryophila TaxID=420952 RepID=UPI00234BD938|nr:hypothetical protein [Paraburkholderia bryophila]WCM21660.1 hypothetical protein NDK50_09500 [Paraburkholderia bryophila]
MPVDLPIASFTDASPVPPRLVVWLGLLMLVMLAGAGGTLFTWPQGEPTGSPWFWTKLLVLPALGFCVAFGLRLFYYEQESERVRAEVATLKDDQAKALLFASAPLAVLDCRYLCALENRQAANQKAPAHSILSARVPHSGGSAVRHTALKFGEPQSLPERYRACFLELLDEIGPAIASLPLDVPFNVCLALPVNPENLEQDDLSAIWQSCWRESGLRPAKASRLFAEQGLMPLDGWLDVRGDVALEKVTLYVCAQLHATPPHNSAEAAVALLLGWPPLLERRGLKPLAMLHRPVDAGTGALDDALLKALLWGRSTAPEIGDLWQAGLASDDKPAILQSASALSLGVSKSWNLSGVHDIDTTLGHAGVAAGWLATAFAVEHVAQAHTPQLIAYRAGSLQLAVVNPVARHACDPTERAPAPCL